ncbi:MAG: LuxR C-terminal-related transcriptional regulator [Acidimicrobiales bacterium]
MQLAEKTIKNYVSNLLRKLGMSSRTEAAVYATSMRLRHAPGRRREPASSGSSPAR